MDEIIGNKTMQLKAIVRKDITDSFEKYDKDRDNV